MISTAILFLIGIGSAVEFLFGEEISLPWYLPLSIICAGIVCALPSLLLMGFDKWKKKKLIIMIAIHLVVNYLIVAGLGYVFRWYTKVSGFISVSISFVLIYIFVWAASIWTANREVKEINSALEMIRDEE